MQRFLNQLIPLLVTLFVIAAFAFGIVLLVYFLIFCAVAGLVIYCITWIRRRFFAPKVIRKPNNNEAKSGRIIDSDDWKEL